MLSPLASRLSPRAAFTLIEILVVLIIILILMGIVFAVYADALTNARVEATRSTIRTLDSQLQERQEAFERLNLRSQAQRFRAWYATAAANNLQPPNIPQAITLEAAEMIVYKDRFRAAFPQRLEDLWGFDATPGTADDAPLWTVWKRTNTLLPTDMNPRRNALPADRDRESSELLYLALTKGGAFGRPSQGLDSLNPNHVRDAPVDHNGNGVIDAGDDMDGDGQPDGNGLMEIVDDWGNPLRFYNWPTRLVRPGGDVHVLTGGTGVADISIPFYIQTAGQVFTGVPAPSPPPPAPPSSTVMDHWFYNHPLNQDPQDPTSILAIARDGEDLNRNAQLDPIPPQPYADNGEDFDNNGFLGPWPPSSWGAFATSFQLQNASTVITATPFDETYYHTLNTYHVPLIVSAGPDGRLGLYEPDARDPRDPSTVPMTVDFPRRLAQPLAWPSQASNLLDQLYDNVTNRRR